jgi:hypothetical protein
MSTVAEIESAIEKLEPAEKKALRDWILSKDLDEAPVLHKLGALIGSVSNLPTDLARNHDHYLHGKPKRSE